MDTRNVDTSTGVSFFVFRTVRGNGGGACLIEKKGVGLLHYCFDVNAWAGEEYVHVLSISGFPCGYFLVWGRRTKHWIVFLP